MPVNVLFNFEGPQEGTQRWANRPLHGGVAQLGEHLPCKQGVDSSILFISTRKGERADDKTHGLIAQVVRAHA